MCDLVEVDGLICENRGDLERALGGKVEQWADSLDDEDWPPNCCLCPCDHDATAAKFGRTVDRTDPWIFVYRRTDMTEGGQS
jgi:hypothetical protein